jgi:glyoxylase-like metal-dependent hydrolase (beta-lactamase superfamily II)
VPASVRPLSGDPPRFEGGLQQVADGAWAWLQPNGGWGEANAGLVVGGEAALLVDTLWDERLARQMLDAMTPVLQGRELRYVFNTHSDGDHWWGNRAVPAPAEILTTTASRATMDEDTTPHELARLARLTGLGARLPGPLHGLTSYVRDMLAPFDFGGVELRFPDRSFEAEETLLLGERAVRLRKLGPAHTPGDAIVHVPDVGVVFAADVLFVGVTPVMWFGPLEGWIAALDTLLSLDAALYVPGHGPVCGRDGVLELREYMTWLGDVTRTQHAAGRTALDAARAAIAMPEFGRWRDWLGPERIVITVDTINRHLQGSDPVGISAQGRAKLFKRAAALQTDLSGRTR